jgi:hypothetical protein
MRRKNKYIKEEIKYTKKEKNQSSVGINGCHA